MARSAPVIDWKFKTSSMYPFCLINSFCSFQAKFLNFLWQTGQGQEANEQLVLNGDGANIVRLDNRRVMIQVP